MKSFTIIIILIIVCLLDIKNAVAQTPYQGPVDDNTYLSTVRVTQRLYTKITKRVRNKLVSKDTITDGTGTGFFVYRIMPNNSIRLFLVTNKHMIGNWSLNDSLVLSNSIYVSFYTKNNLFKNIDIQLKDSSGNIKSNIHPYPNQVVDIVVIEITNFIEDKNLTDIAFFGIPIDNLISITNLSAIDTFTGSQVLITGYPSGIGIASQSKPIVKSAIISSPLTETIDINMAMEDRKHKTTLNNLHGKLILIDGYIVGGNSGGPVFTPRYISATDAKTKSGQFNYIIGIVSSVYNNTGVSLIYSADYIKDLIYKYTKN